VGENITFFCLDKANTTSEIGCSKDEQANNGWEFFSEALAACPARCRLSDLLKNETFTPVIYDTAPYNTLNVSFIKRPEEGTIIKYKFVWLF